MILTQCAACAKPLEHDAPARCVGCQTRYCSDRCLRYHSHRGGHDDACEETIRATIRNLEKEPTQEDIDEHNIDHANYRSWCPTL